MKISLPNYTTVLFCPGISSILVRPTGITLRIEGVNNTINFFTRNIYLCIGTYTHSDLRINQT